MLDSDCRMTLIVTNFGAVLGSACEEGLIRRNPVRSAVVRIPPMPSRKLRPRPVEQVLDVIENLPVDLRPLTVVAAGCGLRQREVFAIRAQDIDFLRLELHVRQQIRLEGSSPVPALPKYGRTRTVPMPEWLAGTLARHLETVQRAGGGGRPLGGRLFYSRERKPLNRNYFNQAYWRPALRASGVSNERDNGMHALRHACASLWLEHGVSIKAVWEYLGHADPGFTLRIYTHVMPTSGDSAHPVLAHTGRTRRRSMAQSDGH
jgi:integrase